MTKTMKLICGILAVILVLAVAAGLVLNAVAYRKLAGTNRSLGDLQTSVSNMNRDLQGSVQELQLNMTDMQDNLARLGGYGDDVAQEDDVRIAGDYMIRSTKDISDAYLSGDASALSEKQQETLRMASAILDEIIEEGMTDYEKEKAVYEWMTTHLSTDTGLLPVIGDTQADCDNPYGVLKYHNAVCVGYATTFRLFMHMLEIPCMVVHNSERYHSWDLTQLDGGWYHTDIYSDAGSASYNHFNLTDSMQGSYQSWNTDFFPAADSYEYCYAYTISQPLNDVYEIPALMRQALDDRVPMLSLKLADGMGNTELQIAELSLNQVQDRINSSTKFEEMYMEWNWLDADETYLVAVSFHWPEEDDPYVPDEELPEDAYEKIYEAVENAFSDIPRDNYWEEDEGWEDWEENDGEYDGPYYGAYVPVG